MARKDIGIIRQMTMDDAQDYADMMTRSEEGWPWHMGGGVPYTARAARQQLEENGALGHYIAQVDNKIVGVCTVYRGLRDENSGYIGFLNVEPEFQGKRLGKRLLRAGVDRAIQEGVERIDLHTWKGNLKAVPLYKKMGFFWVPETSVYMINLMPLILKHHLFQDFFDSNPDWYRNQVRDLSAEPDLRERDGIGIYQYSFRSGDQTITALADREGLWITGGSNRELEVWVHPQNEVCPEGLPQRMFWEIENRTDEARDISLVVNAPQSVEMVDPPPDSISIPPGERVSLEGTFRIDPEAQEKEDWEEPDRIISTLTFGDRAMSFKTGFGRKGALSFGFDPRYMMARPGSRTSLQVRIKNRTKTRLQGRITASPLEQGLQVESRVFDFQLSPEGYAGFSCQLAVDESCPSRYLPIRFRPLVLDDEGNEVVLREKILHASCVVPGTVLHFEELNDNNLHLCSGRVDAAINLRRGGQVTVRDRETEEMLFVGLRGDALGPPFRPTEFDKARCSYSLETGQGYVRAKLRMKSKRHRGLSLVKHIILRSGSPVLTARYGLINEYPEPRSFDLKTSAHAMLNHATIYIPHSDALLCEKVSTGYPYWRDDAPRKPEDFAEGWMGFEGYKDKLFTVGSIWPRETGEVELGHTLLATPKMGLEVGAHSRCTSPPLHFYIGEGDWRGLREAWRRLSRNSVSRQKTYLEIEKRPPLSFGLRQNLISSSGRAKGVLYVSNLRGKRSTGKLTLKPPAGWSAEPERISFQDLSWDGVEDQVEIRPQGSTPIGVYPLGLVLETGETRTSRTVPLVHTSGDRLKISSQKDQDRDILVVDNGFLNFRVCPAFGGTVYSLQSEAVEYLSSSFPEPEPRVTFNPWYGGATGCLNNSESRGWCEEFDHRTVREGRWRGVETSCRASDRLKDIKGAVIRNRYLTMPSSNILRLEQEIKNETTAGMEIFTGAKVFPSLGEEGLEPVIPDREGNPYARSPDQPFEIECPQGWVAVRNPELDRSLVFAGPSGARCSLKIDWMRGLGFVEGHLKPYYGPGQSRTWSWHLALCSSDLDDIRTHGLIRELGPRTESIY